MPDRRRLHRKCLQETVNEVFKDSLSVSLMKLITLTFIYAMRLYRRPRVVSYGQIGRGTGEGGRG